MPSELDAPLARFHEGGVGGYPGATSFLPSWDSALLGRPSQPPATVPYDAITWLPGAKAVMSFTACLWLGGQGTASLQRVRVVDAESAMQG